MISGKGTSPQPAGTSGAMPRREVARKSLLGKTRWVAEPHVSPRATPVREAGHRAVRSGGTPPGEQGTGSRRRQLGPAAPACRRRRLSPGCGWAAAQSSAASVTPPPSPLLQRVSPGSERLSTSGEEAGREGTGFGHTGWSRASVLEPPRKIHLSRAAMKAEGTRSPRSRSSWPLRPGL